MQLSLDQLATQKLASHEKHFGTQQRMLRLSSGSPKHTGRLKGKELDGMSFRVQAGTTLKACQLWHNMPINTAYGVKALFHLDAVLRDMVSQGREVVIATLERVIACSPIKTL